MRAPVTFCIAGSLRAAPSHRTRSRHGDPRQAAPALASRRRALGARSPRPYSFLSLLSYVNTSGPVVMLSALNRVEWANISARRRKPVRDADHANLLLFRLVRVDLGELATGRAG